jgi:fumarate reductase flavoprotein subunit
MKSLETDVAIVGAGIAGLVTALRLAEHGVRSLVLEKGDQERYPCNTRVAGGAFHVAHRDVAEDPEIIRNAVATRTRGAAREDLVNALAGDIGSATQWLRSHGVRFIKVGHETYRRHTLAPPIATHGRNYWEGRGGDVLLRTLEAALVKAGGGILRGYRARQLLMDQGACTGVTAEHASGPVGISARAVVICDGGFHSDPQLMREFISPAPERLLQRNAGTGTGDGIRMARAVGAKLVGMDRFYGHVMARDALDNPDLWPFPMIDFVCAAGLVVDSTGRRFMDEGLGGVTMANRIARQADPLGATVIFDSAIWNGPGREYLIPANPTLVTNGGTLLTASDLPSLAAQIGVPAETLVDTVGQFNAAVAAGQEASLSPHRTTAQYKAMPIQGGPFHAVRLCAGITYTMGGLAIDADGHVLDEQEQPIPGLYSAGCAAGGIEGGRGDGAVAYVGGLTRSTVFALRAANALARERVPA